LGDKIKPPDGKTGGKPNKKVKGGAEEGKMKRRTGTGMWKTRKGGPRSIQGVKDRTT